MHPKIAQNDNKIVYKKIYFSKQIENLFHVSGWHYYLLSMYLFTWILEKFC